MPTPSPSLLRHAGLGALLLVACGDDGSQGVTASAGTTALTTLDSSTSTTSPTSDSASTSDPTTGGSDSQGATTTATTEALTSSSGTTGVDPTTGTTGTTTTGETTTGETTGTSTTDTTGETTGNSDECKLAAQHLPCDAMSDDPLHAMGLNCSSLGGMWIDKQTATAVQSLDFQAPPPMNGKRAWQVAKTYGSYIDPNTNQPFWTAREGDKMLMISSGLLPSPSPQGVITIADGEVYNNTGDGVWDSDTMPPPMNPNHGSPDPMGFTNCDGTGDCSNTLKAQWDLGFGNPNDKMWFHFEITAPAIASGDIADANGYSFDFAYFSAEFPEYVNMSVNDMFVVWQDSEDYTGNVTFVNGQPMTVTALWPVDFQGQCNIFNDPFCVNPADPHLAGTGHQTHGGATSWYKALGGVKPGETFVLSFAIYDMGDSTFDTTALLDNWQWDCEGCVPSEVDDCGIIPQ